jgi:Flp pilus assembly protein TadD
LRTRPWAFILVLLLAWPLAACSAAEPTPEATATEASTADEHFRRGNQHAQEGQFEDAIAEYQAALAAAPDHVSAMTNLGVAYYNTGQLEKAIAQYQAALDIAPNDADIHSNLAAAHVQVGDLDAALQEYQKAVELDPDLAQARFGLGVVYAELGEDAKAIEAFEQFQALDAGQDPMATDLARQYLEELKGP